MIQENGINEEIDETAVQCNNNNDDDVIYPTTLTGVTKMNGGVFTNHPSPWYFNGYSLFYDNN